MSTSRKGGKEGRREGRKEKEKSGRWNDAFSFFFEVTGQHVMYKRLTTRTKQGHRPNSLNL